MGLLKEVEDFIENIETSTESALALTEIEAGKQNIDKTVLEPIIERAYQKARWLQRTYLN
mgnify:CR=1 FL=1